MDNYVQWSDIAFEVDGSGIKTLLNAEAVKESIRNILMTRVGERPMRRSIGADIESHLFDLIDEDLQDFFTVQIKSVLEAYDDRIEVLDIQYNTSTDRGVVEVGIYYTIPGFDKVFEYFQVVGD